MTNQFRPVPNPDADEAARREAVEADYAARLARAARQMTTYTDPETGRTVRVQNPIYPELRGREFPGQTTSQLMASVQRMLEPPPMGEPTGFDRFLVGAGQPQAWMSRLFSPKLKKKTANRRGLQYLLAEPKELQGTAYQDLPPHTDPEKDEE